MALNKQLAQKVLDQIETDPESFDMDTWETVGVEGIPRSNPYFDPATGRHRSTEYCGTTRCIAGWAIYFAAQERGIDTNRPLWNVHADLAVEVGLEPRISDYANFGALLLGLGGTELFFDSDRDGYKRLKRLIKEVGGE